ncbi:galactose-1-epimerase [Clostridium bovifaecis]|uniref:Aldose 1-epimerase n=1 Tax=Clostridium bovifaecis TaxID=2184719 RepID=A0A6I6EKT1_9CLOT|nr:galactose-1-epimerase [Clostridium bovifaecis]
MYSIERAFDIYGKEVKLITIRNDRNMEVKLLNYGATLVELLIPDRDGNIENVVLTHDEIEDYISNPSYFGATVGRTSGRIDKGRFVLDGKTYNLNKNYGVNQGHGGNKGFSFRVWDYSVSEKDGETAVQFTYYSKDMEENYPGNLMVKVTYTLRSSNELVIEYEGATDKKTLCNLTNHTYFNLSGNYKRKITKQYLKIKSKAYLEMNESQIPIGKYIDVEATPMDFSEFKLIGRDIEENYIQLSMTKGYDHTWILNEKYNQIEMVDKLSGRKMTISTTYPSVVIYSFNFPSNERLKQSKMSSKYDGICFETQYEPDGINNKGFNSGILDVGEKYHEKTEYKFFVIEEMI